MRTLFRIAVSVSFALWVIASMFMYGQYGMDGLQLAIGGPIILSISVLFAIWPFLLIVIGVWMVVKFIQGVCQAGEVK